MTNRPKLIWLNVAVFSLTSAVALIAVPLYGWFFEYDAFHLFATLAAIGFCGMSITAGYHRLWAHRAYKTKGLIRWVYAFGGAFAMQNSAMHWASDHRMHHRFVDDEENDPYSASRGFWYSHIGWMLREYQATRYHNYDNVKDLQRDPIVVWQHKHYLALVLIMNIGLPLLLGVMHGDVVGVFLTVGVLRLVISHHITFLINSLAHIWGNQPYNHHNSARDNGFIAFFTFGEGYHNFHHQFQFDYRNGIRWWQFDPTKWWIKCLNGLGLANDLKRCDEARIEQVKAKLLLQKTCKQVAVLPNAEELVATIKHEYDLYYSKLVEYYRLKKQWISLKKGELIESCDTQLLIEKYHELKQNVAQQRKQWLSLNQTTVAQLGSNERCSSQG